MAEAGARAHATVRIAGDGFLLRAWRQEDLAALLRHAIAEVLTARLASLQTGLDSRDRPTPADVLDQLLLEQDEPFDATASLLLQVWSQVPFERELAGLASAAVTDLLDVVTGALAPWGRERFGADADDRVRDAAGVSCFFSSPVKRPLPTPQRSASRA